MKFQVFPIFILAVFIGLVACQNKKAPVTPVSIPKPVKELTTVYYDFDKSNIRQDQADALLSNGEVLRTNPNWRVTIEGNCDERGTNEYNMALGDRRARSARDYLVNIGIDPAKMTTVSYGEEKPVCYEHNESCWWRNRRGDFVR